MPKRKPRTHECPGRCGETAVPNRMFACRRCWGRLPVKLQQPILNTVGLSLVAEKRQAAVLPALDWYAENPAPSARPRSLDPGHKSGRTISTSRLFMTLLLAAAALFGTACTSDAQRASENASTAADNFEVLRRITVVNTWSPDNAVIFDIQGRCALNERDNDLVVTCKEAPNEYVKHYVGLRGNVTYTSVQLKAIDVDVYRTRVIFKPQNIIPNVDLSVGNQ